jgi:predicted transcriptional regulator
MSPREHQFGKGEKAAVSAAIAAAIGAISVFWARHRTHPKETVRAPKEFHPEILNSKELDPKRLKRLNDTMALLILGGHADRAAIMGRLNMSKHHVNDSTGYLTQYGLITRKNHSNIHNTSGEYVAVVQWKDELPALLQDPSEATEPQIEQIYPHLFESMQYLIGEGILRKVGGSVSESS